MRAITPVSSFEYVCKADRELPPDSPERTVWVLRQLTAAEEAQIQDAATSGSVRDDESVKVDVHTGTVGLWTLRRGIVGVRNFRDENGQEVRPTLKQGSRQIEDAFIDRIPREARDELVRAITEGTQLDEATAGKSLPPST